jgi:hypothetical protein
MHIVWTNQGSTGANVSITLLNNSAVDTVIAASAPNNGVYNWSIPASQTLAATYQVKVTSLTTPSITSTSGVFEIAEIGTLPVVSGVGFAALVMVLIGAASWTLRQYQKPSALP